MLIKINRFLTRSEIERLYQIPPDVLPTVMADVPVVHHRESGEECFAESTIDLAVENYAATVTRQPTPAPKGKPGRRKTTDDIAVVINDLKAQGKPWKEICVACKSQFPGRITTLEQVRTIWRRYFGNKK
jgi:hypothetical protein